MLHIGGPLPPFPASSRANLIWSLPHFLCLVKLMLRTSVTKSKAVLCVLDLAADAIETAECINFCPSRKWGPLKSANFKLGIDLIDVWVMCSTHYVKVVLVLSRYFIFTSHTMVIFQHWISVVTEVNPISGSTEVSCHERLLLCANPLPSERKTLSANAD